MKKLLPFFLLIIYQSIACQITFEPTINHSFAPYTAKIYGTGTIYYTTDGSEPTNNSQSGTSPISLTINQTTKLKAKLANGEVFTNTFYYGQYPQKKVFFKPPTNWSNVCSFSNSVDPQSLVDVWGPGSAMTSACDGWYTKDHYFFVGQVTFNNCGFPEQPYPYFQFYSIATEDTIFYDYSAGPISNPPTCLLAVNDPSKKIAIVKIFPNPVQDYVNIESDKNFIAYEIIDESGKLILNKDFKGSKIDISNLKTGVYFIKLKSLSNETNIVKFIKK